MKILHLIIDDKFNDYAIEQFDSVEIESVYLLIKAKGNVKSNTIRNIDKIHITYEYSEEYYEVINDPKITSVISHGLFYPWQERIINLLYKRAKIAWVFYGGEIYGREELQNKFLENRTKLIFWKKEVKRFLNHLIKNKKTNKGDFFVDVETFRKIDYCLTDMPEEYQFVKRFSKSSMQHLWYNYYSIEETIGDLVNCKIDGSNILLGNSCSLSNNHLDAFNILKKLKLKNKKIIVPLSYGHSWLRNMLVKEGNKYFGKDFIPLLDFLELKEYNKIISSCSIVIMPHIRPQAQGNIITSLWLGAKVFFNEKSMTYTYFKNLGVTIFSIQKDLNRETQTLLLPLSESEIEHNRNILKREYGKENMMKKIKELVVELNS